MIDWPSCMDGEACTNVDGVSDFNLFQERARHRRWGGLPIQRYARDWINDILAASHHVIACSDPVAKNLTLRYELGEDRVSVVIRRSRRRRQPCSPPAPSAPRSAAASACPRTCASAKRWCRN